MVYINETGLRPKSITPDRSAKSPAIAAKTRGVEILKVAERSETQISH